MRLLLFVVLLAPTIGSAAEVSFRKQLAPILARRCLGCHSNRKTEGRYALHTFEAFLKTGDSGEPLVVPGAPEKSYLFQKLIESDPDLRMPQEDDPLSEMQIDQFRQWIEQGAKFDGSSRSDRIVSLLPPRVHPDPPETYRVPMPVFSTQFSPDGRFLLTAGYHEILVWDVGSLKLVKRLQGLPQRVHSIRFSPDGSMIAVGGGAPGDYGEIRLIDWANTVGKQTLPVVKSRAGVRTLAVWEDMVIELAFSTDGKFLVAGGADKSVRCYDVSMHEQVWRSKPHVNWVTAVDVTDYRFAEERMPNEEASEVLTFNEHDKKSGSHVRQHWAFPDGSYIVREADWELSVRDQKVSTLTRITITGIGKTYSVKREEFSGDQLAEHSAVVEYLQRLHESWGAEAKSTRFVLSSSRDKTVKVLSLEDGSLFTTYKGHRREYGPLAGLHRVFGVQAEPGSRRVWSGGEGKHFHGWNPVTVRDEDGTAADMEARFAKEYSIDLIHHDFTAPVFSIVRDHGRLFAAAADGQVKQFAIHGPGVVFDAKKIGTLHSYSGQKDYLFTVSVCHERGLVAAAGYSGDLVVWDIRNGEEKSRFSARPPAPSQ